MNCNQLYRAAQTNHCLQHTHLAGGKRGRKQEVLVTETGMTTRINSQVSDSYMRDITVWLMRQPAS